MADRKVLIKYYPPDFDPDKLIQKKKEIQSSVLKKKKNGPSRLMNVRFMFPFTMCCGMCNEFIYIGTKFNSRVEKLKGEDYHGIPIWRFHARCPHCRAEIAFKTDPENTEYILESGGTRTYDPRKDADLAESVLKSRLNEEIAQDSILALEHKTHSTINELQALEQIDELRKLNKRNFNNVELLEKALKTDKSILMNNTLLDISTEEVSDFNKGLQQIKKNELSSLYNEKFPSIIKRPTLNCNQNFENGSQCSYFLTKKMKFKKKCLNSDETNKIILEGYD